MQKTLSIINIDEKKEEITPIYFLLEKTTFFFKSYIFIHEKNWNLSKNQLQAR
jgi:hypothetical protein